MNKELLHHLSSFVNAVTRGDYCKGQEVTRRATGLHLQKNEKEFLESLELMSVKLEAREYCLEQAINDLRTRNAELMEEKQRNRLFSTIFVSLFLAVTLYISWPESFTPTWRARPGSWKPFFWSCAS